MSIPFRHPGTGEITEDESRLTGSIMSQTWAKTLTIT